MYKVASDKRQSALHRGRPWDWANGDLQMTAADRYSAVVCALHRLHDEINALPPKSQERKELGVKKFELQNEAIALKAQLGREKKATRATAEFFIDIAREQLLPSQFRAMWAAALRAEKLAKQNDPA